MKRAWREGLLLPLLAGLGALLLAGFDLGTRALVARNEQHAADRVLLDTLALPAAARASLEADGFAGADLGLRAPRRIYLARVEGRLAAIIVPVTAREGFGGDIDLLVGVDVDGRVAGVRVLRHHESAGFGAVIAGEHNTWIEQFVGKSLAEIPPERWALKKDGGAFDQITGATVTSRAVTGAVARALRYVADHRAELSGAPPHD